MVNKKLKNKKILTEKQKLKSNLNKIQINKQKKSYPKQNFKTNLKKFYRVFLSSFIK